MNVARSLELHVRQGSTLQRIRSQLPTYLSDFREQPRWLLMFLFGRTAFGRGVHRRLRLRPVPATVNARSMFEGSAAEIVAALRKDGLFDGLRLPETMTAEIRRFAEATPCFGNHDRGLDLVPAELVARQSAAAPVTSGHYFERVLQCKGAMAVQADPLLHAVARGYLGDGSRVISTRLWWSFPPAGVDAAADAPGGGGVREMLHFDLDDWRMLKFFFYLTPVHADAGPHLFLRGSHRGHVLQHQLSLTVSQPYDGVVDAYGPGGMMSIHGDAGWGFAEDPYGFHAGSLARTTPRLMMEIGFGVSPPNRRRFFGQRVV